MSNSEKPGAVIPHAGICEGAAGQLAVLPRYPRSRAKLKGYVCNRNCQRQVLRVCSLRCWRCSGIPVISNIIALLIGSTVIKFLAVIVNVGRSVISPLLLMWQVTQLVKLCAVFICNVFHIRYLSFGSSAFNQHCKFSGFDKSFCFSGMLSGGNLGG